MKIEFRKVPVTKKEFQHGYNSVNIEGTFCKISPTLVKVESTLEGTIEVECCRCGDSFKKDINEELNFLISNGVYKGEEEDLIIEIENEIIDFDEICESETSSIKSDYHICKNCDNDNFIDKEF